MKDQDIENLIDSLNNTTINEKVFISPLSKTVDLAKVWRKEPEDERSSYSSLWFYFIKNDNGEYVAAVYDMGQEDLHVFVKETHRKKGHLSRAIHTVIMPHLYQSGRDKQFITFSDSEIGEYVVRNWSFEIVSEGCAYKDLSCYVNSEKIVVELRKTTTEEVEMIKKRINIARLHLKMASEHMESICGEGNDAGLGNIFKETIWLDTVIPDLIDKYHD